MKMVYPTDTNHCALCNQRMQAAEHLAFYIVGARAALGYVLCKKCGPQAQRGLPPDQLRKLDNKLEAEAERLGLTSTQ